MRDVQQAIPFGSGRPETGPMQFGDDWPGVFIRGDNAFCYAMCVRRAIELCGDDFIMSSELRCLARILESCVVKK